MSTHRWLEALPVGSAYEDDDDYDYDDEAYDHYEDDDFDEAV